MSESDVTRGEFNALRSAVDENTALTKKVQETTDSIRDILATFRIMFAIAKWLAAVAAAGVALAKLWATFKGSL